MSGEEIGDGSTRIVTPETRGDEIDWVDDYGGSSG